MKHHVLAAAEVVVTHPFCALGEFRNAFRRWNRDAKINCCHWLYLPIVCRSLPDHFANCLPSPTDYLATFNRASGIERGVHRHDMHNTFRGPKNFVPAGADSLAV